MPHFAKDVPKKDNSTNVITNTNTKQNSKEIKKEEKATAEEIVDLIASNFFTIPSHRRLHLFQAILRCLPSRFLPLTLLIILLSPFSHANQIQINQQTQQIQGGKKQQQHKQNHQQPRTEDEELMEFCRELMSSFGTIQILECISSMLELTQHFALDSSSLSRDSQHIRSVFWWLFKSQTQDTK